jgi:hypothetical protein
VFFSTFFIIAVFLKIATRSAKLFFYLKSKL